MNKSLINPRILAWRPLVDRGNLRGFATVQVGPVIFEEVRLVQQPGQKPFVSPPQKTWTDNEGQSHFAPIVRWPQEWNTQILIALMEAESDYPNGFRQNNSTPFRHEVQRRAGLEHSRSGEMRS